MRIIALMNQKGGVGKTTTTVNLGAALAERGKRVCLVDLDPQAHLTINYGVEPSPDITSLYDVLVEEAGFLEAVHQISDRIALVPSSIDLAAAEIELVTVLGREMLLKKRIEAAVNHVEGGMFDYILLDCPPSLGLLTINALAVATEVIIPMQAHFLALQGVAKLLETVQLVNKRMNPRLKVSGIALTMYDSQTKLTLEVVHELNSFIEEAKATVAQGKPLPWAEARIFRSKIRRNIKLAESPSFGQTILTYDSASNGAADYRALAAEIIEMESPTAAVETVASPIAAVKPAPVAAIASVSRDAVAVKPVAPKAVAPEPVKVTPVAPRTSVGSVGSKAAAAMPVSAKPATVASKAAVTPVAPKAAVTPVAPKTPPVKAVAPRSAAVTAVPTRTPSSTASAPGPTSAVTVSVNPTIDSSKLAAAKAEPHSAGAPVPGLSAKQPAQKPAGAEAAA